MAPITTGAEAGRVRQDGWLGVARVGFNSIATSQLCPIFRQVDGHLIGYPEAEKTQNLISLPNIAYKFPLVDSSV